MTKAEHELVIKIFEMMDDCYSYVPDFFINKYDMQNRFIKLRKDYEQIQVQGVEDGDRKVAIKAVEEGLK